MAKAGAPREAFARGVGPSDRCTECGASLLGSPSTVKRLCSSCAEFRGRDLGRLVFKALREMAETGGHSILRLDVTHPSQGPVAYSTGIGQGYRRAPGRAGPVEVSAVLLLESDMIEIDDGSQVQAALDDMGPEQRLSDVIHDTQYHPAVREALKKRRRNPPHEVVMLMQEVAEEMEERTTQLLDRMARADAERDK